MACVAYAAISRWTLKIVRPVSFGLMSGLRMTCDNVSASEQRWSRRGTRVMNKYRAHAQTGHDAEAAGEGS